MFNDLNFKGSTRIEVIVALANCGEDTNKAKRALVTWIRHKQEKGRSTEHILAKLWDIESKFIKDTSLHSAFRDARAETFLPMSREIPTYIRPSGSPKQVPGPPSPTLITDDTPKISLLTQPTSGIPTSLSPHVEIPSDKSFQHLSSSPMASFPEESESYFTHSHISLPEPSSHFYRLQTPPAGSPPEISPVSSHHVQGYRLSSNDTIDSFQEMVEGFRTKLADSQRAAKERKAALKVTIQSLHHDLAAQHTKSKKLERIVQRHRITLDNMNDSFKQLRTEVVDSQKRTDSLTKMLRIHQQKHQCETLFASSHPIDTAKSLFQLTGLMSEDEKADTIIMDWLPGFTSKCISALETMGDEASSAKKYDEALSAYATALSLGPSIPTALLTKWARIMLLRGLTNELLDAATSEFKVSRFSIYRAICEVLVEDGRLTEAIKYLQQIQSDRMLDTSARKEGAQWELYFRRRCSERLEKLADIAIETWNYHEAEEHFSTLLTLDTLDRVDILVKRSKARIAMKLWHDALQDADEVIQLDPSSYRGYEWRHAALHGARRYVEAIATYDTMLSKLEKSPDLRAHDLRSRYTDARPTIREIIHTTLSHMPHVLIDTTSGQLLDKVEQAKAFEAHPIFSELVSSMTTHVDVSRIRKEVKEFYRYVMLSHRWQLVEPCYEDVKIVTVYGLEASPGSVKLQKFCHLVQSLGFRWAWSDTCCIDKGNTVVLQESLVAMFPWYRGSSLTIVYLLDVLSELGSPDGLQHSIWNTRAWTYLEYVAAETIQFYTQDWKPYLGLTLWNHKESPIVISEMERALRVSAEQIAVIRPDLDRVREKLYLASMRQSIRVEDIAYSLLGIFNISIPVIYGEGTRAVGRFLEQILTGSGDVKILAWTGTANDYHSCLPLNLRVYDPIIPLHIPIMDMAKLELTAIDFYSSTIDVSLSMKLHDKLNELPLPAFTAGRLRLPCIAFHITKLIGLSGQEATTNLRNYHVTTTILGDIELTTRSYLNTENEYCLVHPWIHPLLEQADSHGIAELDKTTRALRLVTGLKQQFGALLFEKILWAKYKRVAADSLIMAQIRDEVPLTDIIDNIAVIDVV